MSIENESEREHDEMRRITSGFLKSIREIMDINPGMPASQIYVLALVALNEGKSLVELANMSGIRHATISRYLLDLSDKMRDGGAGFNLVNRETDPHELRRNMYTMAPKGRHLMRTICHNFTV